MSEQAPSEIPAYVLDRLYAPNGAVDYKAVGALLAEGPDLSQITSLTDPDNPTDARFAITFQRMAEVGITAADPEWRRQHPTDFAIASYMVKEMMEREEYPVVLQNEEVPSIPYEDLDFRTVATGYFKAMETLQVPAYTTLTELYKKLAPPTANVNELECVVAIPVAAHQENKSIYRSLVEYSDQDLKPEQFEIILALNSPIMGGEQADAATPRIQETKAEIRRFKRDHPEISLRGYGLEYFFMNATMGRIRGDLWNLIGYDLLQRGRDRDVLVISGDADTEAANRVYLSDMVDTWHRTHADVVVASLQWASIPGLPSNAIANRMLYFTTFLERVRQNSNKHLLTWDGNTGVSMAAAMAAGGFPRSHERMEMSNLTSRIRFMRSDHLVRNWHHDSNTQRSIVVVAANAVLKSKSRRLAQTMAHKRNPYLAWSIPQVPFDANDVARGEGFDPLQIEANAQAYWQRWQRQLEYVVANLPLDKRERLLKQARHVLGFDSFYAKDSPNDRFN